MGTPEQADVLLQRNRRLLAEAEKVRATTREAAATAIEARVAREHTRNRGSKAQRARYERLWPRFLRRLFSTDA